MFRDAVGVRHATTPKSMVLGQDSFKGMGVAFADLTDTGVPDIVVSNITEPYALQESDFVFLPSADRATVGRGLRDGVALYDDHIVFGLFFALFATCVLRGTWLCVHAIRARRAPASVPSPRAAVDVPAAETV